MISTECLKNIFLTKRLFIGEGGGEYETSQFYEFFCLQSTLFCATLLLYTVLAPGGSISYNQAVNLTQTIQNFISTGCLIVKRMILNGYEG